ncbi:MAG: hypothetical protein ACTIJN_07980, partial [Microbacterium gubbeenense]
PAEPTDPAEPTEPAAPSEPAAPTATAEPTQETAIELTDGSGNPLDGVAQGGDVTFRIAPVEAGTEFAVTVHSDPVTLPTAVGDADGVATSSWTVPADFPVGDHTVRFVSDTDTYELTFTVLAADAPGGGSGLAPTGSGPATELLAGAGIMTILCGAVLILVRRRVVSASAR